MPITLAHLFKQAFLVPLETLQEREVSKSFLKLISGLVGIAIFILLCVAMLVFICLIPITVPSMWVYFKATEEERIARDKALAVSRARARDADV